MNTFWAFRSFLNNSSTRMAWAMTNSLSFLIHYLLLNSFCLYCSLLQYWIILDNSYLSLLLFLLPEPMLPTALSHLSSLCHECTWAWLIFSTLSYMFFTFILFFSFSQAFIVESLGLGHRGLPPFIQSCVRIKRHGAGH